MRRYRKTNEKITKCTKMWPINLNEKKPLQINFTNKNKYVCLLWLIYTIINYFGAYKKLFMGRYLKLTVYIHLWMYGIQLKICAIISKDAPWYIKNCNIHRTFKLILLLKRYVQKHDKILHHINVEVLQLLSNLMNPFKLVQSNSEKETESAWLLHNNKWEKMVWA